MQKVYVSFDKVVLVAWLDTQPTTKSVRRNSDTVLIRKPHSFLQARALSYWTRWLGFPACLLPHLSSPLFCTCLFDSRVSPSSLQSKQQLSSWSETKPRTAPWNACLFACYSYHECMWNISSSHSSRISMCLKSASRAIYWLCSKEVKTSGRLLMQSFA